MTDELDMGDVHFAFDVYQMTDLLRKEIAPIERELRVVDGHGSYTLEFLSKYPGAIVWRPYLKSVLDKLNGLEFTFETDDYNDDNDFDYLLAVCYTAFRECKLGLQYHPALRHHFGNYWTCTVVD